MSNVPCKSILYALLNSNQPLDVLIREESQVLEMALEWFNTHFFVVNDEVKTEKIKFLLNYVIHKDVKLVKLLSIYIDSRLSWDCHVE